MTNERVPTVTADTPASRLVEPAIPVFPPSLSVGNILERIRSEPAVNFPYIAACEAERLLGIAPAASLLRAPPATIGRTTTAYRAMTTLAELKTVGPADDLAKVLALLAAGGLNQIPLIDGRLLKGMIEGSDVIAYIQMRKAIDAGAPAS